MLRHVGGPAPAPGGEAGADGAPAPEGTEDLPQLAGDVPAEADEEESPEGDDDTPVCGTCGASLKFRAVDETTLEVFCAHCDETTRFKAAGEAGETEEAARPARPPRREFRNDRGGYRDRGGYDRGGGFDRGGEGGGEGYRSKGCRRCGGQIDFEPLPDGGRTGVCRNCGNRFTLPPKRDEGDDDRRGRRPYSPRGDSGGRRYPPKGGRRFDRR